VIRADERAQALIEAVEIKKEFPQQRGAAIVAVDDVTLSVRRGESLGIVGESGSGKTTLARCIVRLIDPTSGRVQIQGADITNTSGADLRRLRRGFQMIFQDPYDSLDPRWRIDRSIEEPLKLLTDLRPTERRVRVQELLSLVRLGPRFGERYPHQLSGGQQQRAGIARALATSPSLVVLDEPTSALDALVKVEILELLNALRRELQLTYVYISHDIGSVRQVCDRIAVMYLGRIVEDGPTQQIVSDPQHPYTKALMSAVLEPRVDARPARNRLEGEIPSATRLPSGCVLHTRCPVAVEDCATTEQRLIDVQPGHRVACSRVTRGDEIEWPSGWDTVRAEEAVDDDP
jgi:peptide/nickel transport system ATP-binding protein